MRLGTGVAPVLAEREREMRVGHELREGETEPALARHALHVLDDMLGVRGPQLAHVDAFRRECGTQLVGHEEELRALLGAQALEARPVQIAELARVVEEDQHPRDHRCLRGLLRFSHGPSPSPRGLSGRLGGRTRDDPQMRATGAALPARTESARRHSVPRPGDRDRPARRAHGVLAAGNRYVAQVDVLQPLLAPDLTRTLERRDRRRRQVGELEIRHEPRYVPRRLGPKRAADPAQRSPRAPHRSR